MRFVFHFGLATSFLLAFAQAPFSHEHKSDPLHKHAHGFMHAHLGSHFHVEHEHAGLVVEADEHDSDARLIDWLAGDGSSLVNVEVTFPESIVGPTLLVQIARVPELQTRNHDPPILLPFIPRGPPA